MTIFGRRNRPAPSSSLREKGRSRAAEQKLRQSRLQRRQLLAEPLEPRAMMDGGGFQALTRFPFWNIVQPKDVNSDGRVSAMDALTIVNDLNLRGARSLATNGAAVAGENDGQHPSYIDVNNDNRVSAFDALQVINALNSAGEGEPLVRYTVDIVAMGTNDPITEINKGGFYEMRVLVTDLGELMYMGETRPATLTSPPATFDDPNLGKTLLGVFTTFFDVTYNTTATDVQINESQHIVIGGSPIVGRTFTLTVNDNGTPKTTGPIVFANNRLATAANIQNALNAVGVLGAGTVEVTHDPAATQNRWRVRFLNRLSNRDMPEMTGNVSALGTTPADATISITETQKGVTTNSAAYSEALLPRVVNDGDGFPINTPLFYVSQRGGSRMATGINDVGGTGPISHDFPGTEAREVLRVRMNALDAGTVNFNVSLTDILDGLETGLYGFENAVSADLIEVIPDTLIITEPLSAGNDTANTTEGSVTPITINVLANDVNNPATPSFAKRLVSVDLTGTLGSAVISGTQIIYTPPGGDINGPDIFRYTVRDAGPNGIVGDFDDNTDIATVTVNIAPVNDAPNVNGPASQTFNEDVARVFSTGNGNPITITDVDAANGLLTLTLNVGAGNGTLLLGNTAGLVGLSGNGTNSITTQGNITDLNAALQNLTYTPAAEASGTVTLAINVNDNGNTPAPALQGSRNITLNITAVNDAPVVQLGGFTAAPMVVEGDPLILNAANNTLIQVSDVDAGAGSVLVTLNVATGNTIHVNPTAGVTIGTNDTNNVTLTGTIANVNTALNGITYTAAVGFAPANETLQITVNDQGNTGGAAQSDTESVTIAVEPATRPRARADVLSVAEDSVAGVPNTVDVLINDIVNLPGPPTVSATLVSFQATSVNGGTITLNDGGTAGDTTDDKLIYVPAANFFGSDSFQYTMFDTSGMGVPSTGTVNVTVTEINDPVVAVDDGLTSVAEDSGARTISAASLTGNDSAGPLETAQTLTITSVSNPIGGTVTLVGGNPVFTPTLNYNGPASFDYVVTDNGTTNGVAAPQSDTGTVTFTITEVNDAPTAVNQTLATVPEDTASVTIPFATLLTGATAGPTVDPGNENAQTLTISAVSAPVGGTVNIVGTDVIFTPTANFNGTASFTFTVTDNGTTNGAPDPKSANATASFTITPVNDAPVAVNDTATTGEEQQMNISVLANDFDVDVSPFTGTPGQVQPGTTISIVSPPAVTEGTVTVVGNVISFTPASGFFGTANFTYQLNDNSGAANNLSNVATVSVTVVERNDPPVVANDTATTPEDPAIPLAIDILANDTDPDTDKANWSVTIVTPPLHGTAVFNTTTRVVDYTPALNYNGPDSFVYKVNDQSPIAPINLDSGNATVSITVTEVNDAPIANPDPVGPATVVIKDGVHTFTASELLANDLPGPVNESSQTITLTSVSYTNPVGFTGGSATLAGGVVTYTAPTGYVGPDSFTYTITDNGTTNGVADPKTATAIVSINVRDFIPTDIQGFVYVDANNNGVFDPAERPLGGVEITLAGTSEVTGPITPITMITAMDGFYRFAAVEPGTYTLTENSPFALRDGRETPGLAASLSGTNDVINVVLPQLGVTGGVSVNNFAELGVDAAQLTDSAGLVSELLASSTSTGFVLASDLSGDLFWSWALNGWNGATSIKVTLDADLSAATLVVGNGLQSYTTRIYQNPYDTRNANRNNPDAVARLARFRLLGHDANGNYIIRLDGRAEHFYGVGTPLAVAPAAGEGVSAGEYVDGVDAAMAEESWA